MGDKCSLFPQTLLTSYPSIEGCHGDSSGRQRHFREDPLSTVGVFPALQSTSLCHDSPCKCIIKGFYSISHPKKSIFYYVFNTYCIYILCVYTTNLSVESPYLFSLVSIISDKEQRHQCKDICNTDTHTAACSCASASVELRLQLHHTSFWRTWRPRGCPILLIPRINTSRHSPVQSALKRELIQSQKSFVLQAFSCNQPIQAALIGPQVTI